MSQAVRVGKPTMSIRVERNSYAKPSIAPADYPFDSLGELDGTNLRVMEHESVVVHRVMTHRTLETLSFDNTYACLPQAFFARLHPTPFSAPPYVAHANPAAAELIELDPKQCARAEFTALLEACRDHGVFDQMTELPWFILNRCLA